MTGYGYERTPGMLLSKSCYMGWASRRYRVGRPAGPRFIMPREWRGRTLRSSRLLGPAMGATALVAIMLIAGWAGAGGALGAVGTSHPADFSSSAAARALRQAAASLAQGGGPAAGLPSACTALLSGLEPTCSLGPNPAATPTLPGQIGSQKWESEVAPGPRIGASMAFDSRDRYVVLFGGYSGTTYLNDTWIWSNQMWVELSPALSPPARANASFAFDSQTGYLVLFGGTDGQLLNDTWKFEAGVWTPLAPVVSPSPREGAAMAGVTGGLVLFGGQAGASALGDTWTFARNTWTLSAPTPSPAPRWGAAITSDAATGALVMFGGANGTALFGDTWVYSAGVWSSPAISPAPSPRVGAGLAFDTVLGEAILFGGASRSGGLSVADGDTWALSGGTWSQIVPAPGVHPPSGRLLPYSAPEARQSFGLAYSAQTATVLLFGGITSGDPLLGATAPDTQVYGPTDTWSFNATGWQQVLSQAQNTWALPSGRVGAGLAYDPTAAYDVGTTPQHGYAVAFGGSTAYGPSNQTWVFLARPTTAWSETFPSISPSARSFAAMMYDPHDGYVVLFGGMNATGAALNDTWTFQNGSWNQLFPTVSPPARFGAQITYDGAGGYLLLFGGENGTAYFSDTWTFQGGTWTPVTSPNTPPARAFGGLAYQASPGYDILFGGTNGASALGDTWKFAGGSWSPLHPTTAPPASWGFSFVTDTATGAEWLYGGCTAPALQPLDPSCASGQVLGGVWRYHGAWGSVAMTDLLTAIPAAPGPRYLLSAVQNPFAPANVIMILGGLNSAGQLLSDRWNLNANKWVPWAPPVQPPLRYGAAGTYDDRSQSALLFGGIGQYPNGTTAYLNDTWMWDTGVWGQANPSATPSARAFAGLTYFGTMNEIPGPKSYNFSVLFGGIGPTGYLGDTWRWVGSEHGGFWTNVTPSVSPSARSNMSMAYDAADNEVVLFGGQNSSGFLGDTWVFGVSGTWTLLSPTTSPSPRAGAAMVYDHEDGYLVLFGGRNAQGALGDTWTFLHGIWTQLSPTNSPSPRYGASIIDAADLLSLAGQEGQPQVVFLIAGTNGTTFYGDTWAFLAGNWTLVPPTVPGLVPFAFGTVSDDWDDGHVAVFTGLGLGGMVNQFWEFKHGP